MKYLIRYRVDCIQQMELHPLPGREYYKVIYTDDFEKEIDIISKYYNSGYNPFGTFKEIIIISITPS